MCRFASSSERSTNRKSGGYSEKYAASGAESLPIVTVSELPEICSTWNSSAPPSVNRNDAQLPEVASLISKTIVFADTSDPVMKAQTSFGLFARPVLNPNAAPPPGSEFCRANRCSQFECGAASLTSVGSSHCRSA